MVFSTFNFQLSTLCLIAAWLLDLMLGDPSWLPHPVVAMGKWIAFGEKRLNKGRRSMLKGAVFAVMSICAVFALTALLFMLLNKANQPAFTIISICLQVILIFFCLAGKTLRKEVRMVFKALNRSLDEGRKQVARIVGRDTSQLSAQEVRTAALETLAENLSDGVIAPLFWFALLGVPGMLTYKMINTFDSMIGYQNERYRQFGCWAAHIDDIANYIPARITALFITLTGWIYTKIHASKNAKRNLWQHLKFVCHYGPKHASPNSGWPEAALASILDCRFGGTHNYFGKEFYKPYIGKNPRPLTTNDMKTSNTTCLSAEITAILIACLILFAGCRCRTKDINTQENSVTVIGTPKTKQQATTSSSTAIHPFLITKCEQQIPEQIISRKAYIISYNKDTRCPNWVGWMLTSDHAYGDLRRRNDFHEDEDVPKPRATSADYKGSGWSRGHMCPAGDNKWDAQAMFETFSYANICPQNTNLNNGLWNSIENDCRKWAKRYGEVFIVCGPLYLNQEHQLIGENKITVPEAFFKAILRLNPEPQAFGFIVRNTDGIKKRDLYYNSIDELERITHYDFFSALHDSLENTVESSSPNPDEW